MSVVSAVALAFLIASFVRAYFRLRNFAVVLMEREKD